MSTTSSVLDRLPAEDVPAVNEASGSKTSKALPAHENKITRLTAKQWLQILSTFMVFFNTWGMLLTFGVFQAYYEEVLLPDQPSSNVSWISTTSAFLLLAPGLVSGPLFDRGFYRSLLLCGSIFEVFGLLMLSLSTKYYQLMICQGILVGIGAGTVFIPSVAAAAACLPNPATRARAMGLAACGSGVGGIIYPIMFRHLIVQIGFPWAVRSIALVVLVLYMVSFLVLTYPQPRPAQVRRMYDISALTDWPFMAISFATLLGAVSYYVPQLYAILLTEIRIPSISSDLAFDLISIINGSSIVGRIVSGLIAAVIGPTETLVASMALSSIVLFCWIVVDTVAGTVVWAVFWGMTSGAMVSLPGAIVPLFCHSLAEVGTRTGMYWCLLGVGLLIGGPIGGAIYDLHLRGNDWWHIQVFAGVVMFSASLLTVYPVVYLRRKQRKAGNC